MKLSTKLLLAAVLPILIAACNNPSENKAAEAMPVVTKDSVPAFDLAKAKSAIEAANERFAEATRKGDSAGMAANYAEDAWLMPPNSEPVKGQAAIGSVWMSFIKMGVKDVKLIAVDVTGNADLLAETGTYEIFADKSKSLEKGKYVVVWKNVNGIWKMYRDIFNSSMPLAKK